MKYILIFFLIISDTFSQELISHQDKNDMENIQQQYKKRQSFASCGAQLGLKQGQQMSNKEKKTFNECLVKKNINPLN